MTTQVSDDVVKDWDLEPRVNRRRPFDLHWRKAPLRWQGNVEMAYRRLNPQTTAGGTGTDHEFCCVHCGSGPCSFDHDQDKQKTLLGLDFVGKLLAEKNCLVNQLNEVKMIRPIDCLLCGHPIRFITLTPCACPFVCAFCTGS